VTRKIIIRTSILFLWLAGMFWLIRFEAYPEWFTHSLSGYDDLLGRDTLISTTWMRVIQDGKPVGYSHTSVDVDDGNALRHIIYENRTHVRLEVMGHSQLIQVVASAYLDMSYRMQQFEFSMHTGVIDMEVTGQRAEDHWFNLRITTAGTVRTMRLEIPDDVLVQSPMTVMAVRRLKVGEYVNIRTLNPLTLSRETAIVRAVAAESIETDEGPILATRLEIEYMGGSSKAWINAEGEFLRQETPMGWTLERCRSDQMFEDDEKGDDPT